MNKMIFLEDKIKYHNLKSYFESIIKKVKGGETKW